MSDIRPYRPADREAIAAVCLRTAAGGGDATGVYSDDALMPEVYALPYVFMVFATMVLVYVFPGIALWLPDVLYGNR